MSTLEEKVSRALDSYLCRTGRMTTDTSADWLIEDLKAEGIMLLDLDGLDLSEEQKKIVVRFASWFVKEPPAVQQEGFNIAASMDKTIVLPQQGDLCPRCGVGKVQLEEDSEEGWYLFCPATGCSWVQDIEKEKP